MSESTSETGHAVNISNYGLLIDTCTGFGPDYNPSNAGILLTNMTVQKTTAQTSNAALSKAKANMKEPINQRALLFASLGTLTTKVVGAVNSCGANELVKKDVKTIADRIRGMGKKKAKEDAAPAADGELTEISTSHQGFVQRAAALLDLVNLLATVKEYKPNEEPLKVASLTALQQQMQDANDDIGAILNSGYTALLTRNRTLYKAGTGMVDMAQVCRDYVKSIFGTKASEYKKVTAIKFRDLAKKEKAKL